MNSKENKILDLDQNIVHPHKKSNFMKTTAHIKWYNDSRTTLDTFIKQAKISQKMIANNRPANRYELVEIEALFFYTARLANIAEDALRHQVCTNLKIKCMTEMSLADYTKIRDHLWAETQNSE